MALARADHELTFATVGNFAGDGIVEEAMFEPFDDKPFETVERSRICPHLARWNWVSILSTIVQQSLNALIVKSIASC